MLISKSEMQAQATNEIVQPKYVCNEGKTPSSFYKNRIIDIDSGGNKYILSTFKDSLHIGNNHFVTQLQNNYEWSKALYFAKYNANDSLLFAIKFAECDTNYTFSILHNNHGGVFIALSFDGKLYLDNCFIQSAGSTDIVLFEFDSLGQRKQLKQFGSYRAEGFWGKALTRDFQGNIYLCGGVNMGDLNSNPGYVVDFDSTHSIIVDDGQSFILKMTPNLDVLKIAIYGGAKFDGSLNIAHAGKEIYAFGIVFSSSQNFYGGLNIDFSSASQLQDNIFILKLDSNLKGVWYRRLGAVTSLLNYNAQAISASGKGVAIVGHGWNGSSTNQFYCDGGGYFNGTSSVDYFMVFYDTAGNFKNVNVSKSIVLEYITDMVCDSLGNYYAVGKFDYTMRFPTDTLNSYGSADAMVTSYDPQGNFRWAASGGGFGSEIPYDVAINSQQKMVLVGVSSSVGGCFFGNDTLFIPNNGSNVFYASIDTATIIKKIPDAIDNNLVINKVIVWPNPASSIIYTNMKGGNYAIFNSAGYIVKKGINQNTIGIDVSNLATGLYTLQLNNKTQVVHQKIFIQH